MVPGAGSGSIVERAVPDVELTVMRQPPQTIDLHGEELDVVPVAQVADALAEEGCEPQDVGTQSVESASLDLGERSFAHDQTTLPVVAPVDHDEDLPVVDATQELPRIARLSGDAHPENIHR